MRALRGAPPTAPAPLMLAFRPSRSHWLGALHQRSTTGPSVTHRSCLAFSFQPGRTRILKVCLGLQAGRAGERLKGEKAASERDRGEQVSIQGNGKSDCAGRRRGSGGTGLEGHGRDYPIVALEKSNRKGDKAKSYFLAPHPLCPLGFRGTERGE